MPNFDSSNIGTWFPFDPANEELGGVCLRELTTSESEKIQRLTVKKKKKFRRGQVYEDTETDEKLASKLRWDFCITEWKEVALDGQQLECTADNKVRMMNVIDFVKHVVESLEKLVDTNKTLEEARVKNLPSSPDGKTEPTAVKSV